MKTEGLTVALCGEQQPRQGKMKLLNAICPLAAFNHNTIIHFVAVRTGAFAAVAQNLCAVSD